MVIYVLVDANNTVKSYGMPISEGHVPIENGVEVDTDLDIDSIQIVDNYKLYDGKLVELADEEKPKPLPKEPNKMEALECRVASLESVNAGLLLENAQQQIKLQEYEAVKNEQAILNANMLLEIAMLKGVI